MRAEKKSMADELRSKVKDSGFVIVADYQGLSVAKTTELKKRLRGAQASLHGGQEPHVRSCGSRTGL
jgi:ribosomal protein L10